jgi:mannose-1-phosphate guanylyltransferase/mannose-6-phosphate isomerase
MRYAVVLAGGWGERLWPMSRRGRPKQLLKLLTERSLVRETVDRIESLVDVRASIVMTSEALRDHVVSEVDPVPPERIVGEPRGRNTAPAIALAAHVLVSDDPDATVAVLPADHVITDVEAFHGAIGIAFEAAESERALVTLGITPTRPETGYGYIRAGDPTDTDGVFAAARFEEKPSLDRARSFLAEGGYYWNSGMFVWRADRFLDDIAEHLPEVARALEAVTSLPGDADFEGQVAGFYDTVPSVSVDYGVMEKASGVLVVPSDFGWDDVGSWSGLARIWGRDASGNTVRGDVVAIDCRDSTLYAEGGAVAVLGLSGIVVAHTPEGTLVCPAERSPEVRSIVEELKKKGVLEGR